MFRSRRALVLVVAFAPVMSLAAQTDPPPGIPHKLTICDTYQALKACADWVWNGRDFSFDYGKSAGTGTIVRTGNDFVMTRVDTRDPWYQKNTEARYAGKFDSNHSGQGEATWFIKGRPAISGTFTATFLPEPERAPKEAPFELPPPPDPSIPRPPLPVGFEVCEGECIRASTGDVGTWILRGDHGEARWPKSQHFASLTILRYDANGIVIQRDDLPNSKAAGQTAIYKATIHNGRAEGIATLHWIGTNPKSPDRQIPWFGVIPTTTCDPAASLDAQTAIQVGSKAVEFRQMLPAYTCFLIAAKQGDRQGKSLVGLMNRDGIGIPINYPESLIWFKSAAIQGDYNSTLALAQSYDLGLGVTSNPEESKRWKERAANNPEKQYADDQVRDQRHVRDLVYTGLFSVLASAVSPAPRWP